MRFSVWPSTRNATVADVMALTCHADATGWDGVWYADHFMAYEPTTTTNTIAAAASTHNVAETYLEAMAMASAAAQATQRARIGTLVLGNAYRHPAVLAKTAATVDHISNGRFVLGLGCGWQDNEHIAYGIPFRPPKERLDAFEEACEVIKSLFTNDRSNFEGTYYQLHNAAADPKPVQHPLPLLLGGAGKQRTLRIIARWADEWNTWGLPELLKELGDVLTQHCEAVGRDPSEIQRSANAIVAVEDDPSKLRDLREKFAPFPLAKIFGSANEVADVIGGYPGVGVDELIMSDRAWGISRDVKEDVDKIREDALSQLGG